jgi:hypothetical protein
LEKDTYVDDIITSTDSMQESIVIAQDIETILARGSMGVKAFTFSGTEPDEKVPADGVHVGLLGISGALVPDGRIQGRWTQKWPSKISCGLGSQRPNSKFPNFGLILTIIGKNWPKNLYN